MIRDLRLARPMPDAYAPLDSPGNPESPIVSSMIKPWQKLGSRAIADFHIFKLRADRKLSPRTGAEHEFLVLDSRDWVNIIALTADQQMVMIEQYRHGSNTVELEIPGGVMDPHETSPVATAVRELREETGFEGETARILGSVFANPAIMSNTCYTVLIQNCRLMHPVEFDQGEDLATRIVPMRDVSGLVAAGKINHSLVVVALYYFDLWQRGLMEPAKRVNTPAAPGPSAPENPAPRG